MPKNNNTFPRRGGGGGGGGGGGRGGGCVGSLCSNAMLLRAVSSRSLTVEWHRVHRFDDILCCATAFAVSCLTLVLVQHSIISGRGVFHMHIRS